MKKIKLFSIILLLLITSCRNYKSIKDVRMLKLGMNSSELKYFMGEPFEILTESYKSDILEKWYYTYESGSGNTSTLQVQLQKNKIINLYSY